jgi:hypothetical protein
MEWHWFQGRAVPQAVRRRLPTKETCVHLRVTWTEFRDKERFIVWRRFFSNSRLYNFDWKDDKWMMNWKWFGRKRSWPNLRYYWQSPGGTEENHETPRSGKPISGPRFVPGTTWKRRSVKNSTMTLDGRSGPGSGFSPSSSIFPAYHHSATASPHASPPHEVWDTHDQAAQHHNLGPQLRGFISGPTLGWPQSKGTFLTG